MTHKRLKSAFSMVELLVVIAIVAVLLTLLLPTLSTAREVARRGACLSNLRQFAIVVTLYDQEYLQLPSGEWGAKYLLSYGSHQTLRDEYSVSEKATLCPSMANFPSSYRPWKLNLDLGRTGYYYLGGYGSRVSTDGNYRFGWTKGTNYWPYGNYGYFPALGILKNPGPSRDTPHDRQFLMLDIAYWNDLGLYNNAVQRSNHPINGKVSAEGQNMVFIDGHATWQKSVPGESWKLCQSYYNAIYWNPGFPAPVASPVYMPNLAVE